MKLTLGFSPCPNDTFIFDALVNHKIDCGDLLFEVLLEDVQTLNKLALENKLDITKISYGVLPLVLKDYILLNSGGAMGNGVGPLLIASARTKDSVSRIDELTIGIPGRNTTANMLFSLAYPNARNKKFLKFSDIEEAVLSGTVDMGVIIHENRFTYKQKGLTEINDLGQYWEKKTDLPIPLGGIAVKRTMDPSLRRKIDALVRQSVEYAFKHYPQLPDYVRQYAQEMDEQVMRQHIDLYVNDYSIDPGHQGKSAVARFLEVYSASTGEKIPSASIFSE